MARSNPWKQKPRHTRHTTLIVCEGDTEKTFVKYLRELCGRNCGTRLTIECARGNGDRVLRDTLRRCEGYDVAAYLYDADCPPTHKGNLSKAKRRKLIPLISTPCIEGVFLKIQGKQIPPLSADCKRAMNKITRGASLIDLATLKKFLPLDVLHSSKSLVPILNQLFNIIDPASRS